MELWLGCRRCHGKDRRENQALYMKLKEEAKNCVSRVSKLEKGGIFFIM